MNARELRLGNHAVINGINTVLYQVEWRKKNIYRINDIDSIDGEGTLEPIELTEEWLLKFGFTKDENVLVRSFRKTIINNALCLKELILNLDCMNQYIFIKESSFGKDKRQDTITLFNQDLANHPIYVHKLQNIWFDLTEEELTIK